MKKSNRRSAKLRCQEWSYLTWIVIGCN